MNSSQDITNPISARQLWADVGGTFTDCLLIDAASRRAIKLLSTGIVRATLREVVDPHRVKLDTAWNDLPSGFWTGAGLSTVDTSGRSIPLGTIQTDGNSASVVRVEGHRFSTDARCQDAVVEIDTGLEAPVLAARLLTGTPLADPLPPLDVRLGTTRGTNALLTRSGATTALVVTSGFGDVLNIAEQDRPDLFDLAIQKHPPLTDSVIEVAERLDSLGNVLQEIDVDRLRSDLQSLLAAGTQSLAICLLHAYVNDAHEKLVEQIAREVGFKEISRSSEVAPLIKLLSRAETTTLDAYLNPILASYVERVWRQFGGPHRCRLRLMTSGGNLVAPDAFRGRDSILSGPAGGVVALASVAKSAGSEAAVGLDMGGTSTDVSRFEGRLGRRYESRVAGIRVMTPMMDIETIAAGGGSICELRDGRLTVGPESAGADPGPACYGRGGPLTITDVNLLLGRLNEQRFPFPLDRTQAEHQLQQIAERIPDRAAFASPQALAEGFLQIAVTHMAEAVRTVSTAEGTDVRRMTLVGFGGAAGQHLCRVADALEIVRILDHPDAGMLSALGMGLANIGRTVTRGVYRLLDDSISALIDEITEQLQREADEQLRPEHEHDQTPTFGFECDLRYSGTESPLTVPLEPRDSLRKRFDSKHHETFGYAREHRDIELVAIRCEAILQAEMSTFPAVSSDATPPQSTRIWHQSQWIDATLWDRASLQPEQKITAPAMVAGDYATLLIEPGWEGLVHKVGTIELRPTQDDLSRLNRGDTDSARDPVLLEVAARRFQGIADSMGEVLRRTAVSVNVKQRRDYSCAIFRGDGSLVANAPHVPVHLGAMGHTVRRMLRVFDSMSPGDCYLSNDPYSGGSHLPDVTVVTPVFCRQQTTSLKPDFFVASRAHHAEIGGRTPGSMPPDAKSLAEEGVVIRDFALVRNGKAHDDELKQLLSSGPYPSRNVSENVADIAAQQAAGVYGVRSLNKLVQTYSVTLVDALMGRLLDVAADSMAVWIKQLPETPLRFSDTLDDGTAIKVDIHRESERLVIDFAGTAGVHPHGFNATPAIVTAAVLYVLRSVSGSDLPLCEGVLRDIQLKIPPGLLDPPADDDPERCAAVVAGNVETSQRVVDVLLGALGVAAASQGTMNNLLIGDDTFGYYETIGGGSGATEHHHGADAVHTHMTNTRITDPEVLESRLPVRLHRFAIRQGSGGAGRYHGGNGIIREFEFLKPLVVSLITSRRVKPPYGAAGGDAGQVGENLLIRGAETTQLPPTTTLNVKVGDRLILKTPGGGGWGPADE